MIEENMAIRLKFLIEKLGITPSQFADACRIPRPTFSQILNGRNKKISDQIIRQIHEAYPNVSVTWLLFNEGNMLSDGFAKNSIEEDEEGSELLSNQPRPEGDGNSSKFVDPNGSHNSHENPEIPTVDGMADVYSKENGLKSDSKEVEQSIKEDVKSILKSKEFLTEIAKIQPKPRKVVSVTIYYDDSTFETFKPM